MNLKLPAVLCFFLGHNYVWPLFNYFVLNWCQTPPLEIVSVNVSLISTNLWQGGRKSAINCRSRENIECQQLANKKTPYFVLLRSVLREEIQQQNTQHTWFKLRTLKRYCGIFYFCLHEISWFSSKLKGVNFVLYCNSHQFLDTVWRSIKLSSYSLPAIWSLYIRVQINGYCWTNTITSLFWITEYPVNLGLH